MKNLLILSLFLVMSLCVNVQRIAMPGNWNFHSNGNQFTITRGDITNQTNNTTGTLKFEVFLTKKTGIQDGILVVFVFFLKY